MRGLFVKGLTRRFGAQTALNEFDLILPPGQHKAIVGPNGAGKSVLGDVIAGRLRADSGSVIFNDQDILDLPEHDRVQAGIVKTFQSTTLFQSMTARENVRLAIQERTGRGATLFASRRRNRDIEGEVLRRLAPVSLAPVADVPVWTLGFGQQRLLEIAVALALEPQVLILDEPFAGVAAPDGHLIVQALRSLPPDTAVLFLEHSPARVPSHVTSCTVLANGHVLHEAPRDELAEVPEVRALFQGHRP